MADSTAPAPCALCGGPLDNQDFDRGICHDCRSPKGRIADLDIAIRVSGDDPKRINDWPVIRHLLRERLGKDRSNTELWQRCNDWLQAEGLEPNYYLALPVEALTELLRNGFCAGYQEELERLARQHQADRAAHRVEVLKERDQKNPAKESSADSPAETPNKPTNAKQDLTLLDRFPDTPEGHVSFVEMVRDDIHFAAEGKRNQLTEGYSNETIASMTRGRDSLMAEAARRIATLSELHTEVVEQVARVLRRELTPGTVERIDELLTPAACNLREVWECSKDASTPMDDIRQVGRQNVTAHAAVDQQERPHHNQAIIDATQGDDEAEPTKPMGGKPATVNERMAGTIMKNHEAMGWNSVQWARHLKCAKSSVVETATWKKLESARVQAKAERMKDRRRKPKASDSRRD